MNFLDLYAKRSQVVDWYHQKDKWFSPNTEWNDLDFKFLRLPSTYSFDLGRLREEVSKVISTNSFIHREEQYKNSTYSGISLTSRGITDNPMDDWWQRVDADGKPLEDHSRQLFEGKICLAHEDEYKEDTPAMTPYIKEVISKFQSKVTRVALMQLQGYGAITPHVDFPYYHCIRLHACIFGGNKSYLEIEKEQFHIPEDGNFYMLDTGKTHGAYNIGSDNRINLNINIKVPIELLSKHGLRTIINNSLL